MKTGRYLLAIMVLITITTGFSIFCAEAKDASAGTESVMVVRVYYENLEDINLLSNFDLLEYNNKEEQYVLVIVDQTEMRKLEELGFQVEIDVQQTENLQSVFMLDETQVEGIPGYPCYRTVEETYATAETIVSTYPSLASWIDVGDSWEK